MKMDLETASRFEILLLDYVKTLVPTIEKKPLGLWGSVESGTQIPPFGDSDGYALILENSGLCVLDVDLPGGWASLDEIQGDHEFPATMMVRTQSGGRHYYFALPEGHPPLRDSIGFRDQLDFKAYGYVIIAGSNGYTIAEGGDIPPAPVPQWLLDAVGTSASATRRLAASAPHEGPTTPRTMADLAALAKGRHGADWHLWRAVALGALPCRAAGGSAGKDLGPVDTLLYRSMLSLATEWQDADPAQVASDVFASSARALAAEDAALSNPTYSLDDWRDKFARALGEARAVEADVAPTRAALMAVATQEGAPDGRDLYTHQSTGECYVVDAVQGAIRATCRRVLPIVMKEEGYSTTYETAQGKTVRISPDDLLDAYGARAVREIVRDLTTDLTTFSRDHTLTLPAARRPDVEPVQHPEIARWLEIMIPDAEELALVKTWIGTLGHLGTSQPAIWLTGAAKSGKTLFARALAALWGRPMGTKGEAAISQFNYELTECPIVHFDEDFPRDWKGNPRIQDFKSLVDDYAHSIEQKYRPSETIRGSVRVVLTSNHFALVTKASDLQPDDVNALQRRVIHIDVGERARAYLDGQDVQGWIETGALAEHFRAIEVAHDHDEKLDGHCPTIERKLRTDTHEAYPVLIAIAEWLRAATPGPAGTAGTAGEWTGITVGPDNGVIYVQARKIMSLIQVSDQIPYPVTRQRIRAALASLGEATQRRFPGSTSPRKVVAIHTEHYLQWAEREDDGREVAEERIAKWTT